MKSIVTGAKNPNLYAVGTIISTLEMTGIPKLYVG